jgi:hypothetical protein
MRRPLFPTLPKFSRVGVAVVAAPVALAAGLIGMAHLPGPAPATVPASQEASWQEPERSALGCGALTRSGDVDTTCSTGVTWTYVGDAETTNNLGPRQMSYFRGSDGSLKVVSRAVDPSSPVAVQVGIQPAGQEHYTRVTQRLSDGGMRLIDGFRYADTGAYTMTVHDLSGREAWTRMVNDYREDGRTLRRSVSYLRDGSINVSPD